MASDDERTGIQVISRAAMVLRVVSEHPGGLSLAAIAGQIGLARSTVQRIVQALEAEGFVESAGPRGGVVLGPVLAQLVYRRQIDIVSVARPFLEALAAELNETTALCRLTGAEVTTLDRCIAEQTLRVVFPLGTIPHPAWDIAPGLALLATLSEDRIASLLPNRRHDLTPLLAGIRTSGEARDEGSFIADLSGFAVPLICPLGSFALNVVLPTSRARGRETAIFAALKTCRTAMTAKLDLPAT